MTVFEKIKQMNESELAEFMKQRFWSDRGSLATEIGSENCIDYMTHHYPEDCKRDRCKWLPIGEDYLAWLNMDSEDEAQNIVIK